MPYIVRDLGPLKTVTSSGGAGITGTFGHLDDASSITLFFTSSATAASSAPVVQISMFDPADPFPQVGVVQSSAWFNATSSTFVLSTEGAALVLSNVSFRGLRVSLVTTSSQQGEVICWGSKQISV